MLLWNAVATVMQAAVLPAEPRQRMIDPKALCLTILRQLAGQELVQLSVEHTVSDELWSEKETQHVKQRRQDRVCSRTLRSYSGWWMQRPGVLAKPDLA